MWLYGSMTQLDVGALADGSSLQETVASQARNPSIEELDAVMIDDDGRVDENGISGYGHFEERKDVLSSYTPHSPTNFQYVWRVLCPVLLPCSPRSTCIRLRLAGWFTPVPWQAMLTTAHSPLTMSMRT